MFHSAIYKLTGWFLAILMIVSAVFSVAIFFVITSDANDRLYRIQSLLEERGLGNFASSDPLLSSTFQQDQQLAIVQNTIVSLIAINIVVFFVGGALCYLLSRSLVGRIEKAHDAQSRFTSDASHEFKTPLTTMRTELEVALLDPNLPKKEMRELLESNLEEVNRLSKLAQTLLLLSRLDYANLAMRPLDLASVIAEAVDLAGSASGNDSDEIDMSLPSGAVMVEGNESSLRELFMILIDNALKYKTEGTRVKIRLSLKNKRAVFKISNKGPGIKPEKLPYIFDRFFRADESRSGSSGTGLGLALAKEITKLHNGEITAVSQLHNKTQFTVTLPVKK